MIGVVRLKGKVLTGISSLDRIVGGGFNRGDTILVAGQPGAGKSTLGFQFLINFMRSIDARNDTVKTDIPIISGFTRLIHLNTLIFL